MRRLRLFATPVGACTILAAIVLTASVASAASSKPKLSFTRSNAQIGWSSEGGSSPADDANSQSIRIITGSGGGATAYTYGTDETLVNIRGKKLSEIDNLGFDSRGYLGAGAPRISVGTEGTDGAHTYFLSAFYCNDLTSGGWRTSDFVHDTTGCTILATARR